MIKILVNNAFNLKEVSWVEHDPTSNDRLSLNFRIKVTNIQHFFFSSTQPFNRFYPIKMRPHPLSRKKKKKACSREVGHMRHIFEVNLRRKEKLGKKITYGDWRVEFILVQEDWHGLWGGKHRLPLRTAPSKIIVTYK